MVINPPSIQAIELSPTCEVVPSVPPATTSRIEPLAAAGARFCVTGIVKRLNESRWRLSGDADAVEEIATLLVARFPQVRAGVSDRLIGPPPSIRDVVWQFRFR